MTWDGTGGLADVLGWVGEDVVDMVGMAINDPVCEGLKDFLEVNGTAALEQYADIASMLLLPPFPDFEPDALKPLVDWAEYPPIGVVQQLLVERFALFSERMLELLDVTDF